MMQRISISILIAGFASMLGCATTISPEKVASARIHYDLGVASMNKGDLRGSLRELLVAVQHDPTMARTHNALGLVYHAMGRSKESLEHYQKALELNPDFSEAHNNLGILLLDQGRYDEAVESFQRALSDILYATPALAEGNMGWAYYKKGDVAAAVRHLRNAVAVSPKFCRGYEWLARIGLDTSDYASTVRNALRFERQCVRDTDIAASLPRDYVQRMQYYLGMGYLQQGEADKAKETFAACALDDPDEGTFAERCGQSLRSLQ